jgi:hypothetical protein
MSIEASLDVALRGDTSNLDKALTKGVKSVQDFSSGVAASGQAATSSMSSMGSKSSWLSGAAGGVWVALAMKAKEMAETIKQSIVSAITDMTQLGRTAQMLGTSTSSLAGLQHAAVMAGIGVEEFNHSLIKMQKHIADPGEAAQAFAMIGINVNELKNLSADQAFEKITTAINRTGNAADRVSFELAIFGKGAAGIATSFRTTNDQVDQASKAIDQAGASLKALEAIGLDVGPMGEQIRQAATEAGKLGQAMDQTSLAARKAQAAQLGLAPTGEQVAALKVATQSWTLFQQSIVGVGRSLIVAATPAMQKIAGWFASLGSSIATFVNENKPLFTLIIDVVLEVIKTFWQMSVLGMVWDNITAVVGGSGVTWTSAKEVIINALLAIQYVMMMVRNGIAYAFDYIRLKVAQVVSAMVQAIKAGEAMKKAMEFDFSGAKDALAEAFKTAPESDIEKIIKERMAKAADAMKEGWDAFKKRRLDELNKPVAPDKAPEQGAGLQKIGSKPAAMEFGSKEAFSVLAGTEDMQKKMYSVANMQLQQNKKAVKLLEKVLAKEGIKVKIAR